MRIEVDWALCEANGQCVAEAPEVFDFDENDDLILLAENPDASQTASVRAAVRACPKHALSLSE